MTMSSRNQRCADEFAAAWARKDLAAISNCLHLEVAYSASVGPEPGRTAHGKTKVLALIENMLALDDAISTKVTEACYFDERAAIRWRYELPPLGRKSRFAIGIDLMRFSDGLILEKDAYRKVYSG
jgi:hypothetical protein